jgi:hypothetical protein
MLDRIREMERKGDAEYRSGLPRAWHVVRLDYWIVFNLFFFAVIFSLVYLFASHGSRFPFDDSYVTLQFVRNLRQLGRLTFDGTTGGYGLTSPLQVLLVWLVSLTGLRPAWSALFLGTILLGLTGVYAYYWSKEILGSRRVAGLCGLLLVSSGWLVFDSAAGLETLLFVFLLILALLFFERDNPVFGVMLALLVITRADAWFFIAGLLVFALVRNLAAWNMKRLARAAIGFGIAALLLVPLLLIFRDSGNGLLSVRETARAYFMGEVGAPLTQKLNLFARGARLFYFDLVMPFPFLIVTGLLFARRAWRHWYIFASAGFFYLTYLLVAPGGISHLWAANQHLLLPFIMLLVAEGSFELIRLVSGTNPPITPLAPDSEPTQSVVSPPQSTVARPWSRRAIYVTTALITLLVLNQVISLVQRRTTYIRSLETMDQNSVLPALGLNDQSVTDEITATTMPGATAWFSGTRTIDLTGEVNIEALKLSRAPETRRMVPFARRDAQSYLRTLSPDVLLIREEDKRFLNFDPDRLPEEYRLQNRGERGSFRPLSFLLYRSLRRRS